MILARYAQPWYTLGTCLKSGLSAGVYNLAEGHFPLGGAPWGNSRHT